MDRKKNLSLSGQVFGILPVLSCSKTCQKIRLHEPSCKILQVSELHVCIMIYLNFKFQLLEIVDTNITILKVAKCRALSLNILRFVKFL